MMKSTKLLSLAIAATMLSGPALAQTAPTVRIATGSVGERYNGLCAGDSGIRQQMDRSATVECLETGGSYANADMLAKGEADAALVQANVRSFWEKDNSTVLAVDALGETHREVAHLACLDELGVDDLDDLISTRNAVVAIGDDRSGHQVSWLQFIEAKPELINVATRRIGGDETLLKILNGDEVNCLFQTAGVGGSVMKEIDKMSGGKISLVETWDDAFLKIKDSKGEPLFSRSTIEAGTYPNIQHGVLSTSYDVAAVPALLVVTKEFSRNNARLGRQLRDAARAAVAQGR
jgi:TRAP transporter TAXI family solute receptor